MLYSHQNTVPKQTFKKKRREDVVATVIRKLGEENKKEWELLQESYKEMFLHGGCYAFSIALHLDLGWPIIGLIKDWDGRKDEIYHAAVRSPDGHIFDIRGFVPEEAFGEPYGIAPPHVIREIPMERLLATVPVSEHLIQRAGDIAQILWPELPWKNSVVAQMKDFADELEELCRKHGVWIRSVVPSSPCHFVFGEGGEDGYTLVPTTDGFAINRRIK